MTNKEQITKQFYLEPNRKEPERKYLKVIRQEFYCIEMLDEQRTQINGWPIEKVIDDWFRNGRINMSHAGRIGHHIGYSDGFVCAELIKADQFNIDVKSPSNLISKLRQDKADLLEAGNLLASRLHDADNDVGDFTYEDIVQGYPLKEFEAAIDTDKAE